MDFLNGRVPAVRRSDCCWTVIEGAAAGRKEDRDEFARRYVPAVRAYLAARWQASPFAQELDDATQEVFLECFRQSGVLERADRSRPGGFRAFLYGVVRNVALRIGTRRAQERERRKWSINFPHPCRYDSRADGPPSWRLLSVSPALCHGDESEERPGPRPFRSPPLRRHSATPSFESAAYPRPHHRWMPRAPGQLNEVNREEKKVDRKGCICKLICVFEIEFAKSVEKDLSGFRAFDRNRILKAIEEQLSRVPCVETRNRKPLVSLIPPFEAVPPVWELRIGEYRIFYDVDENEGIVYVRALRQKPPHKTPEEIL